MDVRDIINEIIFYLSTKDKLNILSISKFHHEQINWVIFDEPIYLNKIIGSLYFNKFTNIIMEKPNWHKYAILNDIRGQVCREEKYVNISIEQKNITLNYVRYTNSLIKYIIPNNVMHLSFNHDFN